MKSSSKSITLCDKDTRENSEVEDCGSAKFKHLKSYEKTRKLRDEIVFCLNMLLTFTSIAVIFSKPTWFLSLNSIIITVQMLHRIYEFSCYKWQFYLIDFCYVVNATVIFFCEFNLNSTFIFCATYAFSLGPILLAVFVYKWGFVFHNTVKFTSFWTHFSPGLGLFLHRWFDANTFNIANKIAFGESLNFVDFRSAFDLENFSLINLNSIKEFSLHAFKLYLPWFIVYYLIIFHVFFNFNIKHGYETQYNYLMQNKKDMKRLLVFGEKLTGIAFMFLHLRYVCATILVSFLMLYSFYFGLFVLLACIFSSIWVTSTYYVEYFSVKYNLQFGLENSLKKLSPV
jgi:hypothetical protein